MTHASATESVKVAAVLSLVWPQQTARVIVSALRGIAPKLIPASSKKTAMRAACVVAGSAQMRVSRADAKVSRRVMSRPESVRNHLDVLVTSTALAAACASSVFVRSRVRLMMSAREVYGAQITVTVAALGGALMRRIAVTVRPASQVNVYLAVSSKPAQARRSVMRSPGSVVSLKFARLTWIVLARECVRVVPVMTRALETLTAQGLGSVGRTASAPRVPFVWSMNTAMSGGFVPMTSSALTDVWGTRTVPVRSYVTAPSGCVRSLRSALPTTRALETASARVVSAKSRAAETQIVMVTALV